MFVGIDNQVSVIFECDFIFFYYIDMGVQIVIVFLGVFDLENCIVFKGDKFGIVGLIVVFIIKWCMIENQFIGLVVVECFGFCFFGNNGVEFVFVGCVVIVKKFCWLEFFMNCELDFVWCDSIG